MQKILAIIFLGTAYIASAVPLAEKDGLERDYPRFIQFPNGDGNLHDVDLEAEPDMKLIEEASRSSFNRYLLYTRLNPDSAQTLTINDVDSITSSNFNPDVPTVAIVHGWMSNRNSEPNPTVRAAFLAKSDVNVFVVDWSWLAISDYATATLSVPNVGRGLGRFMNFLNEATGAPYSTMHLVGFSLGAHVVGNAGRETGSRVARVTGLDPAGPLWNFNSYSLSPTDGVYVEAIHTDILGVAGAIAQVDFFPNGGNSQPGCVTTYCNHNRSWQLFAASVTYNHLVGQKCSSSLQVTLNTCRGDSLHLGNDILDKTGSGMYRLDTGRRYPY